VRNEKGWPLKNIKDFSSPNKNAIKAGPFGSSLKKECYTKTGFKIYGQEQVINDDLQFGDYYISEEKYQELINYSVRAGDILISLVGSYGKISIVPESFEKGIINPRLMKISLNQELVLPIYFKHLFLTKAILNQIEELSHGGTMDIINVGIVKQLKFPVPSLDLQQQFVHIVEQVETLREKQSASREEIKGLFEELMQRAFSGELVEVEA
jgi:type I restriction enzyme S subunit